jgi:hypothetical protein
LDRRARTLGYGGLRAYLEGRYTNAGHSLPALAGELGTSVWLIRAAMDAHRVPRLPGPQAKGRARQAASDRHATARAAALGFPDLRAYLQDRYAEQAWPLPRVAGELGTGIRVVRRLLGAHGVDRTRATAAQAAAGARGRALQAASHAARRRARLAVPGFEELAAYLRVRRVEQGWPLAQIQTELGVGRRWLRAQLNALGLP